MAPRVLILSSTASYRTDDFLRAAEKLGVEALLGTDRCHQLAEIWPREAFGGSLPLEFRQEAEAAAAIVHEARARPLDAIIATDEPTADIAARAAATLGLAGNSVGAAQTARNKRLMREAFARAQVPSPAFSVHEETASATEVAANLEFPVVLKPLLCSASRGVMRADDREHFVAAWQRLTTLLHTPALRAVADPDGHRILVESFVPGVEVALEGLIADGKLDDVGAVRQARSARRPLLRGDDLRDALAPLARAAARRSRRRRQRRRTAIGLSTGPIHAELRLSPSGPVVIEVAARSIGGLCARTLRFGLGQASLEELVIRHALDLPLPALGSDGAAGVMMIPIPSAGVLSEIHGEAAARAIELIEDVNVTARVGEVLQPLPEGASYLGFIFARGKTPITVENALRNAHAQLRFTITPLLQKL